MKAQENTLNAQPHCCGPFSVDGMLPVQTYLRIILQQKTLTSGIIILGEVKRPVERRRLKFALPNPGGHVIKQTNKGKLIDALGQEWIYLTVGESVFMLHTYKKDETLNCSMPFEDGVAPLTVVFTEYCIS
ncbi:STAS domain-containing protein [Artemisia annua]|uniref:STAS domain-containing protein n=1 Tax=Artemisia annua TaxID=35608 RepID=A0A2U1MYH0_ARTAN|nr:STAS domain-containing protein [Artemisia annua]